MKKLLLILLCLPFIGFGQKTYVPDDNFEQRLIDLGYDNILDDSVQTSAIDTVTSLYLQSNGTSDYTGIEDFIALTFFDCINCAGSALDVSQNIHLTHLYCSDNYFTSLDVSNNTALVVLHCGLNELTSLDVSNNTALEDLSCRNTEITSLDVSNNTALKKLNCKFSQLTSLDVTQNISLEELSFSYNQIMCLDISNNTSLFDLDCSNNLLEQLNTRNGNFNNMYVNATNNNLTCVEVDNIGVATNDWDFDSFASLTTNCNYANPCNSTTSIQEQTTNKELLKITDLLGRENTNQPLFYIYDDGTVEKRITID